MEIARGRVWYSQTSDGSLSTSSTPILRLRVFGRRPSRSTKCADESDLKFFEELARTYVVGSLLNDTFRPFRVANRQFGDEQLRSRWATPLFLPEAGRATASGRRWTKRALSAPATLQNVVATGLRGLEAAHARPNDARIAHSTRHRSSPRVAPR